MLRGASRCGWFVTLLVLALPGLTGCVNGSPFTKDPSPVVEEGDGPAPSGKRELPVLVEIKSHAGDTYTRVRLRFEPGTVRPEADIQKYDKSAVPMPGSAEPVSLEGEQALKVTVTPARVDEVNVAPVRREDPAVATVRVLGAAEDHVSIGIGVRGTGELRPKILQHEHDTLEISLRNP